MPIEYVLLATTPRYNHEGFEQCLKMIDQEGELSECEESGGLSNPYAIMDIEEESFIDCFVNSGESFRLSWELYGHASQFTLLKASESAIHAVATGTFEGIFSVWTRELDCTLCLQVAKGVM
ncbi:uncharacterized protein N7500_005852 [Penicillium coprophilum]|uniref:uncharacterized protein n=1 Tax=Penicillium coprophilum TaxID=36646 RepID=UPI0023A53CA2|nr:uncharacterized protein N7500_005852 [Penicillium coprophilum]KAJ5164022.1 hypothetical protein N7500_005852 [Penicillium coprophilum]